MIQRGHHQSLENSPFHGSSADGALGVRDLHHAQSGGPLELARDAFSAELHDMIGARFMIMITFP